jgi:hypothetical protein
MVPSAAASLAHLSWKTIECGEGQLAVRRGSPRQNQRHEMSSELDLTIRGSLRGKYLSLVAALILAAWLDLLVTVEWSYPYCMQPSDGSAYPATGFPLPYAVASQASSLEFLFMPHVLALNLLLIGAAVYPLVRFLNRAVVTGSTLRRLKLVSLVVLGVGIFVIRGWSLAFAHPVLSIGDGSYLVYGDLRPVGITTSDVVHSKRACTASGFWFSEGSSNK